MSVLQGARATVVGAGVVGLCVALELQARGADVTLIEKGGPGASASTIAAGMVAPAFEAALEEPGLTRLPLLRAARDLWTDVADGAVVVHREGALWAAPRSAEPELAAVADAMRREGADCELVSARTAHRLSSGLTRDLAGAVFTPEDWRVEPQTSLDALSDVFQRRGGRRRNAVVADPVAETGTTDALVLCTGWGSQRFAAAVPELRVLRPVGGERVQFPGCEPTGGPVIRSSGGYLVPGAGGVIAGASMVEGVALLQPTIDGLERYATLARSWFPALEDATYTGAAGVRAATPDGLPLVGRSVSGVHLATGFRRNGWLLAPLAARMVADQLAGRHPGPWADAFRPGRFG